MGQTCTRVPKNVSGNSRGVIQKRKKDLSTLRVVIQTRWNSLEMGGNRDFVTAPSGLCVPVPYFAGPLL